MNNELRTFKLIDEYGFLRASNQNRALVGYYMTNGCFTGEIDYDGNLVSVVGNLLLIATNEMGYFEEVLPAKDTTNAESDTQTPSKTHSQPLQGTFSDETIHCIMEDCKALDASMWFDKDSVVLLWNEDEYVIDSVDDYHTIVDAIKLLRKFVKV